jgi:inositol hexakisphosphate/diphosphoinositol-pentakisphosphate kinase
MILRLTTQNTAQVFAHALLGVEAGQSTPNPGATPSATAGRTPEPCPLISHLIVRRDLLDDNNAGKEKMAEAKKMLKILLRTGETEKRPDLAWERGFKKEPVEVVAVSFGSSAGKKVLMPLVGGDCSID